jgi:hypothetical protein
MVKTMSSRALTRKKTCVRIKYKIQVLWSPEKNRRHDQHDARPGKTNKARGGHAGHRTFRRTMGPRRNVRGGAQQPPKKGSSGKTAMGLAIVLIVYFTNFNEIT